MLWMMLWLLMFVPSLRPLLASDKDELEKLIKQTRQLAVAERRYEEIYKDLLDARKTLERRAYIHSALDQYVASRIALNCARDRLAARRGDLVDTLNKLGRKVEPESREDLRHKAGQLYSRMEAIDRWTAGESQFLTQARLRELLLSGLRPGR